MVYPCQFLKGEKYIMNMIKRIKLTRNQYTFLISCLEACGKISMILNAESSQATHGKLIVSSVIITVKVNHVPTINRLLSV